jgi:uncharacterized protein
VPPQWGVLTIAVRVKPGAGRNRVGGRHDGAYGPAVVVAVTAAAVDGRANEAVLRVLADALQVRRSVLLVRAGAKSRDKLIALSDPPDDIAERIGRLRDA